MLADVYIYFSPLPTCHVTCLLHMLQFSIPLKIPAFIQICSDYKNFPHLLLLLHCFASASSTYCFLYLPIHPFIVRRLEIDFTLKIIGPVSYGYISSTTAVLWSSLKTVIARLVISVKLLCFYKVDKFFVCSVPSMSESIYSNSNNSVKLVFKYNKLFYPTHCFLELLTRGCYAMFLSIFAMKIFIIIGITQTERQLI